MTATATSSSITSLAASVRTGTGKGEVRRLRRTGQIPAIAYGRDLASLMLTVSPKDVMTILKSERGKNSVVKMKVADKDLLVMIRDYSYHPLSRALEHVDFVEVKLDKEVEVEIPLLFHGKAAGVTLGGIVRQVYRTVPVRALPDRIPVKVEVDITHLGMGEHIATKDLPLAEGVTARLPAEQTLIAIVAPEKDRTAEEEATKAAAAAPEAAAAGGAAKAAAPAKEAAKPAEKKK